jgi:hypothetical protein
VWTIALQSDRSEVKTLALDLLAEPVRSASDHIRMPAVYAIAEIANSTSDPQVKLKALNTLREPIVAAQLPIRNAAIDAVNSIMRAPSGDDVTLAALSLLGEPIRSGNNGVRIPAINALMRVVERSQDDRALNVALNTLTSPLDSMAMIGGMEIRLMAVVAVERIGTSATQVGTKARAMGMLQSYANNGTWEPEAKQRALEAAAAIQKTMNSSKS